MDQNNHSVASEFSPFDRTIMDIKQFERILGNMHEGDVQDDEFWEEMGRVVPGLSPPEVKFLCEELVRDFELIETGQFQLPIYSDDSVSSGSNLSNSQRNATAVGKKKKGVPWSEEEKALFIEGLKKYGKGHWKEISKNFVTSRTPSQVASHAQKYFINLRMADKKKRKRFGIPDLPLRHQETSPASHFPIPTTFQNPPQQQGHEAQFLAPNYLLGYQFHGEQDLPNFSSLPPLQFDQQAQPPGQFDQRVHYGALVPDPAYRLEHQSHQTGYINQRPHLMNSCNWTQRQFNQQTLAEPLFRTQQTLAEPLFPTQQTHAEPLFRTQQPHAELQSKTSFVNLQIFDSWPITSSSATPRSGSDSCPSPTASTSAILKHGLKS